MPGESNLQKKIGKTIGIGIVIYIVVGFYCLHLFKVAEINKKSLFDSFEKGFSHIFSAPLEIFPMEGKTALYFTIFTIVFLLVWIYLLVGSKLRHHDDLDTIAGDAKFMDKKELAEYNKTHTEPLGQPVASGYKNAICSQSIYLSTNVRATNCTLNMLVIAGTGRGKTFRVIGPNILQRNCSMIITDPSGELYNGYGSYLEYYGYKVKCFNLQRMEKSNHYNPFNYIHSDKDVQILVNSLITNTTPPGKTGGDDFWVKSETALLCALISYLFNFQPKEQQTFSQVKAMITSGNIDENNSEMQSDLDLIFEKLRQTHPDSFAMGQYDIFRLGAGKTLKSILISCGVRLQAFDLPDVRLLTDTDDISLDYICDERTAIFVILPTGNPTFNFLAGLMYSQLFNSLYEYCETTARYGYLVKDSDGEVVKAFRASNTKDAEFAKEKAEAFINKAIHAKVVKNDRYSEGKKEFWEVRADKGKGQMLAFRGSKDLANEALDKLKHGEVVPNSSQSHKGLGCPIHVRFLLDEFANTGKIPSFIEKLSTIRKYEISMTIILQSLEQLDNLYEKERNTITGNCDTTIYLGGGVDEKTAEWFVKLCGKKTVRTMNENFSKSGGNESFQRQSLDLISMSQLRTLPKTDCIVIPHASNPKYDKMYDTLKHPEWKLLQELPKYEYSKNRYSYILNSTKESDNVEKPKNLDITEIIPAESHEDKLYRISQNATHQQLANEAKINMGVEGEEKFSDITEINVTDTSMATARKVNQAFNTSTTESSSSTEEISEEEVASMVDFVFGEEMAFSIKPMAE